MMLLAFMVLAVPIALGSVETAAQLARNSRVYDNRLAGFYSAGAGVEVALWELLKDPTFDDDLTPDDPTKEVIVTSNDETVTVTVTKIFGAENVVGQGLIVSKAVDPPTVAADQPTTFTYTMTIKNEGTDMVELKQVYDYLPPGLIYVSDSTSGLTTTNPTINQNAPETCGSVPQELYWNVQPQGITILRGEELTLTFQATGTLADGTYYNQASVLYNPWWDSPDVEVHTPYTAEVTVGTGDPKCGYGMYALITSAQVEPVIPPPEVETEFTYTIIAENVSDSTLYICKIEDLLPPTFTYVTGSTGEYGSNITTWEPSLSWDSGPERWNLRWADGDDAALEPLDTIPVGGTKTQVFRASAIPASGVDYFNEFSVTWSNTLAGGKCKTNPGYGGTSYGGAAQISAVDAPTLYDISAVASDGTIQSRIVFYEAAGEIEIISWQEY